MEATGPINLARMAERAGGAAGEVEVLDAISTTAGGKQPFYASRIKVYPKRVGGLFRRLKWIALAVLLGIYYTVPWLRWDRGPNAPDQAVLIDMPARRAYFLWIEIWPQEIYYITGLLILGALGLFFVTSLFGRVWCGFACPQTVWTDLYMLVERWIEGDRNKRMRLDRAGLSFEKVWKKTAKHSAWLVIAALTGGAWVLYFNDAPTIVPAMFTGEAGFKVYFFAGLFTATTYLLAGWAREQGCTYMCPWPRFQSAMLDEDTMIVTYETWRGEPRGRHKKGEAWDGRGDCVDCNSCVAACPTGIDIRDGNQLECIGCGLCIDACNEIMDKVGRPRELITYDTVTRQNARASGEPVRLRLVRPRTIIYVVLLVLVAGVMLFSLGTRTTLDVNVLHDRNPVFVTLSDGSIRNGYTFKILNMLREERELVLSVEGLNDATMQVVGTDGGGWESLPFTVGPDQVGTYKIYVTAPRAAIEGGAASIDFVLDDLSGEDGGRYENVFRGPEK
jgi:cytochrome c oxidase accessory protein FixG